MNDNAHPLNGEMSENKNFLKKLSNMLTNSAIESIQRSQFRGVTDIFLNLELVTSISFSKKLAIFQHLAKAGRKYSSHLKGKFQ